MTLHQFPPSGFTAKAYCPICHRQLSDVGLDMRAGKTGATHAGTCSEHGIQTPTKVSFQPKGRPLPPQECVRAGTSEKE